MGHPPPAFATRRRRPATLPGDTQAVQEVGDRFGPLPVLQSHAAQLAADPTSQPGQNSPGFRKAKVGDPSGQERVELPHHLLEARAPIAAKNKRIVKKRSVVGNSLISGVN